MDLTTNYSDFFPLFKDHGMKENSNNNKPNKQIKNPLKIKQKPLTKLS